MTTRACFIGVELTHNVALVSGAQQSESATCIHRSILVSHVGGCKPSGRCSWAVQKVLANHPFYTVVRGSHSHPSILPTTRPPMVSPMVTIRLVWKSVSLFLFYSQVHFHVHCRLCTVAQPWKSPDSRMEKDVAHVHKKFYS